MSLFTGAGVAIVTPMNADGSVNYEKLAEILEFQIANETDAIIICGTTGESATLSEEEHSEVIRFCIKTVNHRIPVIAGTGSNCTETAVKLSKEAEAAGADGLMVEVHNNPAKALCDGPQSLTPEQFDSLMNKVNKTRQFFETL